MQFCSKCGAQLQEGVEHQCEATRSTGQGMPNIDKERAIGLLRRPLTSLAMDGQKDVVYGAIGALLSLIGFVLWAAAYKSRLVDAFRNDFFDMSDEISKNLPMIRDFFILGLISLVVFLAAILVFGNWIGTQQQDWKSVLAKFGALQAVSGAGFIVAAVVCFVSAKLSILLLVVLLLFTMMLTLHAAAKVFGIAIERTVRFFGFTIAIQSVVVLFVLSELTEDYYGNLISAFF